MHLSPLEEKVASLVIPVVEDLGFSFHSIKITGSSGTADVQIMAEDPKTRNLKVDDAAKISRAVSTVLDVEDPIKDAYKLEISSPGIDRRLIKEQDFNDYKNFEIKIETNMPAENGQKRFRGILNGIKDKKILVTTDQGDVEIPYSSLSQAKLVLTDELIKATSNF